MRHCRQKRNQKINIFTVLQEHTLFSSWLVSLYFLLYLCTSPFNCWLWFCSDVMRCRISLLMGPVCSLAARFCSNSMRSISYSFRSWPSTSSSCIISARRAFCRVSSSLWKRKAYWWIVLKVNFTKKKIKGHPKIISFLTKQSALKLEDRPSVCEVTHRQTALFFSWD